LSSSRASARLSPRSISSFPFSLSYYRDRIYGIRALPLGPFFLSPFPSSRPVRWPEYFFVHPLLLLSPPATLRKVHKAPSLIRPRCQKLSLFFFPPSSPSPVVESGIIENFRNRLFPLSCRWQQQSGGCDGWLINPSPADFSPPLFFPASMLRRLE